LEQKTAKPQFTHAPAPRITLDLRHASYVATARLPYLL
jgi:hypothetical protein